MKKDWIVVADGSRVRIFSQELPTDTPVFVEEINFPPGREKGSDRLADRPGSATNDSRHGQQSLTPPTDPKAVEHERFAGALAEHLEIERSNGKYTHLVLIMAPRFLGRVRKALAEATAAVVIQEVDKDLVHTNPESKLLERILAIRAS